MSEYLCIVGLIALGVLVITTVFAALGRIHRLEEEQETQRRITIRCLALLERTDEWRKTHD